MKKNIIIAALVVILVLLGYSMNHEDDTVLQGQGGIAANECTIFTQDAVAIGDDISTEVLASHARRAWAMVQQPENATNTVAFGFGQAATLTDGLIMGDGGTATSSLDYLQVGLNTDYPFTGAVNAITDVGSTTVKVVDCRY